jgi:hypothetical protein
MPLPEKGVSRRIRNDLLVNPDGGLTAITCERAGVRLTRLAIQEDRPREYPVVGWEHTNYKALPAPKEPTVEWFLWFGRGIMDCNGNGISDSLDIAAGRSRDVNDNGVLDECERPPAKRDTVRRRR